MWLAKLKMKNNKIPQMERRKKRLGNVNRKKRFCNQTKQGTRFVLEFTVEKFSSLWEFSRQFACVSERATKRRKFETNKIFPVSLFPFVSLHKVATTKLFLKHFFIQHNQKKFKLISIKNLICGLRLFTRNLFHWVWNIFASKNCFFGLNNFLCHLRDFCWCFWNFLLGDKINFIFWIWKTTSGCNTWNIWSKPVKFKPRKNPIFTFVALFG